MRSPEDIRALLSSRYSRAVAQWLVQGQGPAAWPMSIPLHPPTGRQALEAPEEVARWIEQWGRARHQPWQVQWEGRRWPGYGTQRIPVRVEVACAQDVAQLVGMLQDWRMLIARTAVVAHTWGRQALPSREESEQAGGTAVVSERAWQASARALGGALAAVRQCDEADFDRALRMVDWLVRHPDSGMLVRQVPVEGMDTKWLERHRGLVTVLLQAARDIQGLPGGGRMGLRRELAMRDVVVLDPRLRPRAGAGEGLRHLRVDVRALAALWASASQMKAPDAGDAGERRCPRFVVVCENRQSLLSLPDLEGAVAIHGGGYAVDVLGTLPWAAHLPLLYWGDLDQDGFAILDRLRHHHRHVVSVLMDTSTLNQHRSLCVPDPRPEAGLLTRLTPAEQATRVALVEAGAVRLEQERIAWDWAQDRLLQAAADLAELPCTGGA